MDYLHELQLKAHLISCKVLGISNGPDMEAQTAKITRVRRPRPRRYKYKARPPPRFVYVIIPARKPRPPPHIFSLKLRNNFKFLAEDT